MLCDIRVLTEAFDPIEEQRTLLLDQTRIGAIVSFLGLMRDFNDGHAVSRLMLEHYPGMTEKTLAALVTEAASRWPVDTVRILHRVGVLSPLDPIVLIAVAASHRWAAFRACEFLIDHLKTRTPIWKKETTEDGARWVQARTSDADAVSCWTDKGDSPG
jgi:molybdopterin synthase catalytic subunit